MGWKKCFRSHVTHGCDVTLTPNLALHTDNEVKSNVSSRCPLRGVRGSRTWDRAAVVSLVFWQNVRGVQNNPKTTAPNAKISIVTPATLKGTLSSRSGRLYTRKEREVKIPAKKHRPVRSKLGAHPINRRWEPPQIS